MHNQSQKLSVRKKTVEASAFDGFLTISLALRSFAERISARWVAFYLVGASIVQPAQALAGSDECVGDAANGLVNITNQISHTIVGVGGAVSILIIVVGATMVVYSGESDRRVRQGMNFVKQAIVGLIILAGGALIQEITISFVTGATKAQYGNLCE